MALTSDTVADGLTRLRNASRARHASVNLPASRFLAEICRVLKDEGFVRGVKPVGERPADRRLRVYLKYADRHPAIKGLVRISTPGQRQYRRAAELPRVLRGLGVAVVSTSRGVMTEREAYRQRIGGEILCHVW